MSEAAEEVKSQFMENVMEDILNAVGYIRDYLTIHSGESFTVIRTYAKHYNNVEFVFHSKNHRISYSKKNIEEIEPKILDRDLECHHYSSIMQYGCKEREINKVEILYNNILYYRYMNFSFNQITNINFLHSIEMNPLRLLTLNSNAIKHIDPLNHILAPNLESLDLTHNPIENMNILDIRKFPKLKWLNRNKIRG